MTSFRGGLIGCGTFSRNHLHAWREVDGAEIVSVCDLDESKAREAARSFGISGMYTDMTHMLHEEELDFTDVVTTAEYHSGPVREAAARGLDVICQKPLAPSFEEARGMVEACESSGVGLMVHENFRWQKPMRALKEATEELGDLFFGRVQFRSGYDVYSDQPYLAEREQFIILDLGIHLLDLCRFFMGEVEELYCRTQQVNPDIEGEDVATILLEMKNGGTFVAEMSYASSPEEEPFPQTEVHIEGENGSAHLRPGNELTVVDSSGVTRRNVPPRDYSWCEPPSEVLEESVVRIQNHWVDCRENNTDPETTGRDNLRTLDLVFGSYESADFHSVYQTRSF